MIPKLAATMFILAIVSMVSIACIGDKVGDEASEYVDDSVDKALGDYFKETPEALSGSATASPSRTAPGQAVTPAEPEPEEDDESGSYPAAVVSGGENFSASANALEGEFVSVSAGSVHTCGNLDRWLSRLLGKQLPWSVRCTHRPLHFR